MGRRKKVDKVDSCTDSILGNNEIEDVRWLCSLSESELDMLIALKTLAARRATIIGHPSLAEKFDLKTLRHLSFTMMEHLKGQLKDFSAGPDSAEASHLIGECKLSRFHVDDSFSSMSAEELWEYIFPVLYGSSRTDEKFHEDTARTKKRRVAKTGSSRQKEETAG